VRWFLKAILDAWFRGVFGLLGLFNSSLVELYYCLVFLIRV
jgi:hypothetical protein